MDKLNKEKEFKIEELTKVDFDELEQVEDIVTGATSGILNCCFIRLKILSLIFSPGKLKKVIENKSNSLILVFIYFIISIMFLLISFFPIIKFSITVIRSKSILEGIAVLAFFIILSLYSFIIARKKLYKGRIINKHEDAYIKKI
ncbi:MAG: hypothetical protein WCQ54_03585 [Clostridiaceae bacterium]